MKCAYYNDYIRCYEDGRIERLDKRFKNPVWREVTQTNFNDDGYLKIQIGNKPELWHRIVWEAFNGKMPNGLEINHKDINPLNNSLDNLELLTHGENVRYSQINGKCSKPVIGISIKTGEKIEFPSIREAGRNGFNQGGVWKCIKGKVNYHKGYKWCYKSDYESEV